MDQANTLRKLMQLRLGFSSSAGSSKRTEPKQQPGARILTVSSGATGAGKSCIVANLGAMLARSGIRTMMVDGDSKLANLDLLLGVRSAATLDEVLDGDASLREAMVTVERNLWLLPA